MVGQQRVGQNRKEQIHRSPHHTWTPPSLKQSKMRLNRKALRFRLVTGSELPHLRVDEFVELRLNYLVFQIIFHFVSTTVGHARTSN